MDIARRNAANDITSALLGGQDQRGRCFEVERLAPGFASNGSAKAPSIQRFHVYDLDPKTFIWQTLQVFEHCLCLNSASTGFLHDANTSNATFTVLRDD